MSRQMYAGLQLVGAIATAAFCVHFLNVEWWGSQLCGAGWLIMVGLWEQRK